MTRVLITGASSGIGRDLASEFARDGHDVVLVARSEDKLQTAAEKLRLEYKVQADVLVHDLSKLEQVGSLVMQLSEKGLEIDTLVNNAGFGALGDFADLDVDRQTDMMMVNVVALTRLTRLLLPSMIERDRGGILNVGSIAGYQAGPRMAVYYASKAYVLSFTESLREELKDTNLHITLLAPGPTRTGFGEDSGMGDLEMFERGAMSSKEVAAEGFRGYKANKDVVIPGLSNQLMATAAHILPRWATRKVVGKLQRTHGEE